MIGKALAYLSVNFTTVLQGNPAVLDPNFGVKRSADMPLKLPSECVIVNGTEVKYWGNLQLAFIASATLFL